MMMMMTRVMENLFTRKSDQKVLSPFTSITVAIYSLRISEKSSALNTDFWPQPVNMRDRVSVSLATNTCTARHVHHIDQLLLCSFDTMIFLWFPIMMVRERQNKYTYGHSVWSRPRSTQIRSSNSFNPSNCFCKPFFLPQILVGVEGWEYCMCGGSVSIDEIKPNISTLVEKNRKYLWKVVEFLTTGSR